MATKSSGFKFILQRGDGGDPETFTAIAQLNDITPIKTSATIIDSSVMNQAEPYKDKIMGMIDAGQVSATIAFDPTDTTHQNLILDQVNQTKRNFKITFPDGATIFAFAAFVKEFSSKGPIDALMTADVTLEIVGKPTYGTFA